MSFRLSYPIELFFWSQNSPKCFLHCYHSVLTHFANEKTGVEKYQVGRKMIHLSEITTLLGRFVYIRYCYSFVDWNFSFLMDFLTAQFCAIAIKRKACCLLPDYQETTYLLDNNLIVGVKTINSRRSPLQWVLLFHPFVLFHLTYT
jgi:hypothetical protein